MMPTAVVAQATTSSNSKEIAFSELKYITKLGSGAFGIVYLGEYRLTKVAIKQMKPGAIDDNAVADFKAEMELMMSIRPHPNIIQVMKFF
jgi:serine/threonine protein kinase